MMTAEELARATPAQKVDRLKPLCEVDSWDTYGAKAITREALDSARVLLEQMQVVPCSNGGVQIEVHACRADIEIEIGPDGMVSGFSCSRRD
jgi:hypothetical protein